eukprot:324414-Rhodomonas_salina.1
MSAEPTSHLFALQIVVPKACQGLQDAPVRPQRPSASVQVARLFTTVGESAKQLAGGNTKVAAKILHVGRNQPNVRLLSWRKSLTALWG